MRKIYAFALFMVVMISCRRVDADCITSPPEVDQNTIVVLFPRDTTDSGFTPEQLRQVVLNYEYDSVQIEPDMHIFSPRYWMYSLGFNHYYGTPSTKIPRKLRTIRFRDMVSHKLTVISDVNFDIHKDECGTQWYTVKNFRVNNSLYNASDTVIIYRK